MAGSVNKVIIVGNVGKDPEIRTTQDGRKFANLRVATSETWKDKNSGERKEKTEWHAVVVFNDNTAKFVEQYVRKGSKLYIEGQLQTRKWQDQSGADRYSTEIVLRQFRGELTLLGGRDRGNDDRSGDDFGGSQGGGSQGGGSQGGGSQGGYGSGQGGGRSGGGGGGGGGTSSSRPDLDDEIPF